MSKKQIRPPVTIDIDGDKCGGDCTRLITNEDFGLCSFFGEHPELESEENTYHISFYRCQQCLDAEKDNPYDVILELVKALEKSKTALPDAHGNEDWEWCWNELYSESQDFVKHIRLAIDTALEHAKSVMKGE